MKEVIKYHMTEQLRKAGEDEGVITELLKMVEAINNNEYEIDLVMEEIFNRYKLWKFINLKVIVKDDIKIRG